MDNENIICDCMKTEARKRIGMGECKCYESCAPYIIVHGGAGNFSDDIIMEKMIACKKAAINGYKKLIAGETSVDAVESALWWLECDEFFSSGYGSMLNEIGKVQMDASIMDGFSSKCGSVAAVSDIEHPIMLAKYVMNNFPNTIFAGNGAKNLAKHANINWLSEGNMIAPMAHRAFSREKKESLEPNIDDKSFSDIDMLCNSFGTVGCVAYDGYGIAAGTTTGGLCKKLEGGVGDTPILGCGTYATKNVGCSLAGHGESIIRLGLARAIVEDIESDLSSEKTLHKYLNYILKKFEQVGGGIVLQSNGHWATYFTSTKMPYAVIENDLITYGARLYEERREVIAIDRRLLNEKLFSFHEWQKYIECRKTILVHTHFPTKMKYCPQSDGIDDLYLKFFEYITSKSNRQESGIKSAKHALPEEVVSAMTKHVTSLNISDIPSEAIDIFPPSLTPLHSYFQHLLDHPFYDIPRIAQNNFLHTKVGYMTKPDMLTELAIRCGIRIQVIDSNLHFLEKYVPPFEQPRMPSVEELKESIDVRDNSEHPYVSENVNANEYLHAKEPCVLKCDNAKRNNYNHIQDTAKNLETFNELEDFTFTETLPCGRLAVPMDSDNESEEENTEYTDDFEGTIMLRSKLHKGYNLSLSRAEKESIYKTEVMRSTQFERPKRQLVRNDKGQFVKSKAASTKITRRHIRLCTVAQRSPIRETHTEAENIANNQLSEHEDVNISNLQLNDTSIENGFLDLNEYLNLSDVSFFSECADTLSSAEKRNTNVNGVHQFFRPFKDYWMYHCIFSRVKPTNFTVFEKALPRTFRWLLNECALIAEMSTEDLYEEVCLIETYHSQTLTSNSPKSNTRDDVNLLSKNQLNFILSKW